jgi:NAD+ kinase
VAEEASSNGSAHEGADRRLRIGIVVHPNRDIEDARRQLEQWANDRACAVVQVGGEERRIAEEGQPRDCDLVVALGGDGTTLTGIRVAAQAGKPVLGVACGSLGVLTAVSAEELSRALDRFRSCEWQARSVSGLEVSRNGEESLLALNDAVVIRDGEGQVTTEAHVDGVLYARFVGDGFVVSTPTGSSAYTLAAGGPLLAPGSFGAVFTPLASHGGAIPPLVVGAESEIRLDVDRGHGGARLEVDGQTVEPPPDALTIRVRTETGTLVSFEDDEPLLSVLRRRQLITDSPRVIARQQREG